MILTGIDNEIQEFNQNLGMIEKFFQELPQKALDLGIRVLIAAVLFFVGMKLIKLVRKIVKKSFQKANAEIGVIQFMDGLVKVCLYFLLILMIASNFGFDATSIVALLGTAGVTIGLAVQGGLSNLVGGVLILILRPYKVGDYIKENGGGNEGTVSEIGIFYTKLLSVDHKVIVLPNGSLSNSSLINYTQSELRRVDLTIGIAYDADLKRAKEVIEQIIRDDPDVKTDESVQIFVDSLGSSEVVIGARCFCNNADYWPVKWRLTENIKLGLDEAKIEIPFQQIDIHMR